MGGEYVELKQLMLVCEDPLHGAVPQIEKGGLSIKSFGMFLGVEALFGSGLFLNAGPFPELTIF